jgi:hypothetical protein
MRGNRLVLTVVGSILLLTAALWAGDSYLRVRAREHLHERADYWTAVVDREVPIGASREFVAAWLGRRFPNANPALDPENRDFSVISESIDVVGSDALVCNDWVVLIDIALGPDDRVMSRRVTTTGECL